MSNTQILAKAKVLGLPVDAAYQKKADGSSDWIVYGSLPTPEWMSITDLLNQLGNLVTLGLTKDAIGSALPKQLTDVLDKIQFRLMQVYFKKQVPADDDTSDTSKSSEYAFHIEVNLADVTSGFPIEVESISFKIWSTANQLILQEMDINRIEKLLGNAS